MSLTALEVRQFNLLDRIEAGCPPNSADDKQEMLSLGFALSTRHGMSLTTAGELHLANLRSHVRDETAERMPFWKSVD